MLAMRTGESPVTLRPVCLSARPSAMTGRTLARSNATATVAGGAAKAGTAVNIAKSANTTRIASPYPFLIRTSGSIEIGPQPPFRLGQRHTTPCRIIFNLIAPDPGDTEVRGFGMGEVKPADRRGGQHRLALGQHDSGVLARIE